MMKYRGSDDDVIGFGHFSEVRKVKSGPYDEVQPVKSMIYILYNSYYHYNTTYNMYYNTIYDIYYDIYLIYIKMMKIMINMLQKK